MAATPLTLRAPLNLLTHPPQTHIEKENAENSRRHASWSMRATALHQPSSLIFTEET